MSLENMDIEMHLYNLIYDIIANKTGVYRFSDIVTINKRIELLKQENKLTKTFCKCNITSLIGYGEINNTQEKFILNFINKKLIYILKLINFKECQLSFLFDKKFYKQIEIIIDDFRYGSCSDHDMIEKITDHFSKDNI